MTLRRVQRLEIFPSPLRLFVTLVLSIFVGEVVSMSLLSVLLPGTSGLAATLADASLLTLITVPLVWWLVLGRLRRVAASERLRAATAMESAANGIVITGRDGTILWANPSFSRITGYSLDEAIGHRTNLLRSGRHSESFYKELWETILSGRVWRGVMVNRRKDGTLYPEEQTISPVLDARGEVECFIAIKEDVSARTQAEESLRQSEERLRQSQKMEAVGRLAGGVAHDFNNLLTVILGHCDLMLARLAEGDESRGEIEHIRRAGERAASLTRQLLAFSRRQVLEVKVLDLNAVVAGMLPMLRRLLGETIEITTRAGPVLGRVKTDPGQIEQVIMNLAVNARDAMPDGGHLTFETMNVEFDEASALQHVPAQAGWYVMLAVSDTGCGIDEATRSHIFEPFFTTKESGKGTGLGLATVYGIVKQSGGSIWVYSEPGRGATFKIYLPRVEEAAEAAKGVRAPSVPARGPETILLVEDEDTVRSLARRILEAHGYSVLEARGGAEALEIAGPGHDGPIHLLLTDVVMPGMNGRDLAGRLGALHPGIKVLYMSGYTGDAIAHHGVLDVGVAYLPKPFTLESLTRKVREVLDSPP